MTVNKKLERLLESVGDMALKRRARTIVEELNPRESEKILDVGCGDGYYLYLLSNLGINLDLSGVDSDPNALKSARRNLKGKRIRFFQADLMQGLPFKAESFDKAVMSEVAEHLPNDLAGLKEVYRVLTPGGVLVLTVPNANYPFFWDPINYVLEHIFNTHIKEGFWAGIWSQHRRLYKPSQIKRVVEKTGFKTGVVESLTWWCLPFNHNLLYLAAVRLYGGNMSPKLASSISKFEPKMIKKPTFINLAFKLVNLIDKLNDLYQPINSGVGVFVKAIK